MVCSQRAELTNRSKASKGEAANVWISQRKGEEFVWTFELELRFDFRLIYLAVFNSAESLVMIVARDLYLHSYYSFIVFRYSLEIDIIISYILLITCHDIWYIGYFTTFCIWIPYILCLDCWRPFAEYHTQYLSSACSLPDSPIRVVSRLY